MDDQPTRMSSVDVIRSRREELHKQLEKSTKKLENSTKKKDTKPYHHPNNLVKVAAYALVREFLTERSAQRFLQAAAKLKVTPPANAPVNLFRLAFQVLLKGSSHDISDDSRSKYAKLLRYAYEHGVDPVWLPPFLLQAGSQNAIIMKLRKGGRERWLKTKPDVLYPKDL